MFATNNMIKINNRRYIVGNSGISTEITENGYIYYLIYSFEYRARYSYSIFKEPFITAFIEVREDIVTNEEKVLSEYGLTENIVELKKQHCL